MAEQTAEPMEFVSDRYDIATGNPEARRITDPEAASALITEETRDRLVAVLDKYRGEPSILLSGGVDSIFVAAAAVSLGVRPRAFTVVTGHSSDGTAAAAAAAALGLSHTVVRLGGEEVAALAAEVVSRLGSAELWEVTAAMPILAAARRGATDGGGAILTGSGADAIFAGGRTLEHPIASPEAVREMDRAIRKEASTNFTYHRLVPHFYPALLGDDARRLVHVFQTVRFWRLAETLAPPSLFGDHDKLCLRIACARLLDEPHKSLAWQRKHAIQRSSGLMASLAEQARGYAAGLPGAKTYTDPAKETFESIATRLYLHVLSGASGPVHQHGGDNDRAPLRARRRAGRRLE